MQYATRTGNCGSLCSAITGYQPPGTSKVDMPEFVAGLTAQAAAHHMPAPQQRPVDISQSQLPGTSLAAVYEEALPEGTVKDGDNSCDVYHLDPHVAGCAASHAPPCPKVLELRRVLKASPGFHIIYSLSAPAGATCNSAAQCDEHMIMICYGPENKLKTLVKWDVD